MNVKKIICWVAIVIAFLLLLSALGFVFSHYVQTEIELTSKEPPFSHFTIKGDYVYTLVEDGAGWHIEALDKTKTSYEEIPSEMYGLPVVDMNHCFYDCTNLEISPVIPNGVENMSSCFGGCGSLTVAPEIPKSVTDMRWCFYDCSSLTDVPEIWSHIPDKDLIFD